MPFFVGLDLGQAQDFSALAVVEQSKNYWCGCGELPESPELLADRFCRRCGKMRGKNYAVRWLKRWPNGTPYPTIKRETKAILERPPLDKGAVLVVDYTGVGRAVVDEFRDIDLPCPLMPITITAGMAEVKQRDGWHVAKKHIAGTLQVLLQTERLKVSDVKERKILLQEMRAFRVKVNKETGNESFESWRERDHDDMVLAVALPCWYGERGVGKKSALSGCQFHAFGGKKPKEPRVVLCSFDELPRVVIEERALLVTVSDPGVPKGVMPDEHLSGLWGEASTRSMSGNNVASGVPSLGHALQKLVGRIDLRFCDIDPSDHGKTWDKPIPPWNLPARELCISKDEAKRFWNFILKKRSEPVECWVFVGDRRARTLAYLFCDAMNLKRADNNYRKDHARPIWSPSDDENERHSGEPPCRHLVETIRAARSLVRG